MIFNQMLREVMRIQDRRGRIPEIIKMNPITKTQMESEMRARTSFSLAYTSKTAQDLVINRIVQVYPPDHKYAGHMVPGGWEVPIEADDAVPMGQFWVGVDGYDISEAHIGHKLPRNLLKGFSVN